MLLYILLLAIPVILVASRRGDRFAPFFPPVAVVCAGCKAILDIQRLGEIIGWTAFAYYGGKIIEVTIQGIGEPICAAAGATDGVVCKVISDPHETQLIGIVLALVAARAVWLRWRKKNGGHAHAY